MKTLIYSVLVILIALSVSADQISPYAGQETRAIKALSQSEIEGYLSGEGMGYALAAELNHYPGPKHVLESLEQLALTGEQNAKTKELFESMKNEAVSIGRELIEREKELDYLFANETIDDTQLEAILIEIGTLQAKLRYVHLSAHIEQKNILTPHQIMLYDQLRGYHSGHAHHGEHSH